MKKGYSYQVSEEKIRQYMKLPPEIKLHRLESMLRFNEQALDEKTKKIRETFRKGEI